MNLTVESDIGVPAEQAFDAMADVRNETRWNSRVSRSELVSDEPVREGSRFTTVNRGQEYAATIVTYERPQRLVFDVRGGQMDITASFDLAPAGERTHVTAVFDMRPKGFMKAVLPLMRPVVKRDLTAQSGRFAAMCEADREAGAPAAP